MTLNQKLSLKLQQRMVLTPTLQQAIRLLQLTRIELQEEVSQELLENPILEEATSDEERPAPGAEAAPTETPAEPNPLDRFDDKIDVESYFQDYLETGMKYRGVSPETPQDAPDQERYLSQEESLADHLLWQIDLSHMEEEEREVARLIVGNLREDGYLMVSEEELATASGSSPELVGHALALVQVMDPVGVATRDLRECLLVQLRLLGEEGTVAWRLAAEFLPHLERENFHQIAARMGVRPDEVEAALRLIRTLDPKPGLKYNQPVNPTVVPDVIVEKVGEEYKVLLNEDGMPRLRLNTRYQAMAEEGSAEAGQETLTYLRDKMRSALWFLKSIEERQRTIHKVAVQIVEFQQEFLDRGPSAMRPLILRDVAERVGVHESTVSRVVSNKYMQTPRGIFPMKFFFNTGLTTLDGVDVSSVKVKERIRTLVEGEDSRRPMSDQRIADLLKREGVLLARRTVAKYREELRIPTSGQRKKV